MAHLSNYYNLFFISCLSSFNLSYSMDAEAKLKEDPELAYKYLLLKEKEARGNTDVPSPGVTSELYCPEQLSMLENKFKKCLGAEGESNSLGLPFVDAESLLIHLPAPVSSFISSQPALDQLDLRSAEIAICPSPELEVLPTFLDSLSDLPSDLLEQGFVVNHNINEKDGSTNDLLQLTESDFLSQEGNHFLVVSENKRKRQNSENADPRQFFKRRLGASNESLMPIKSDEEEESEASAEKFESN
ncbi:hypothetical protein [Candidatus Odyssella thessalonicensis]|uniref:hypothetical protein n=1 Tax=Candidatus Odyssella thessalonicensis TaxID=84647 RepID=UPI000225AC48|nr:hypothetical protein [Candidatus Odyssella thessalonicensis]